MTQQEQILKEFDKRYGIILDGVIGLEGLNGEKPSENIKKFIVGYVLASQKQQILDAVEKLGNEPFEIDLGIGATCLECDKCICSCNFRRVKVYDGKTKNEIIELIKNL